MSDSRLNWLRLSMVRGIGPMLGNRLISACGNIEALWQMSTKELPPIDGMGPQLLTALKNSSRQQAEQLFRQCKTAQINLLCPDDTDWPPMLRSIDDAPLILFYRGNAERLSHQPMLAIVGARHASAEGKLLTRRWSRYFAERKLAIISGMAFGIDSSAHGGALEAHGITIAALGCGLQCLNEQQQRQVAAIAKNGCVISEFRPDQSARPAHFPRRNRLIAALAQATLVMEADIRSGSLITARHAASYGRDLFAVPGSVLSGNHEGCHQLIRDGAMLLEKAEQLLCEINYHEDGPDKHPHADKIYHAADKFEAEILTKMAGQAVHLDLLAETCSLTLPELSTILLRLELQGVIERLPGSRYVLAMELSNR
ncbi:MAG: DNA-processing protein DprA [Mariprofundus sp.]|nr:DNA-processing protein DprA [Mariprofundus sp.]